MAFWSWPYSLRVLMRQTLLWHRIEEQSLSGGQRRDFSLWNSSFQVCFTPETHERGWSLPSADNLCYKLMSGIGKDCCPGSLQFINVGGKYRTCWITWLVSNPALRMVLPIMKEELCFSQAQPGKGIFPSCPSFLLNDLSMQLLVSLVLEEAFSRAFLVFVILIETNSWWKILVSGRKQRKASSTLHTWVAKNATSVLTAEVLGSAFGCVKHQVKNAIQVNCSLFSLKHFGWRRFPEHKCYVFHIACSSRSLLALGDERGRLRQDSNFKLASGNDRMR